MKFIDLYKIYIILILFSACSDSKMNNRGFDANRNSEHRSQTYPSELNNTDSDSSGINSKPRNTPKASPTDKEDDPDKDLKWI